jgi:DNA-binding NtrC family response regulator
MENKYKNCHILVVDDEESILDSLERILKRKGFKVTCKNNSEDALEFIKKEDISLIITDLRLPKMSGLDLLKLAKKVAPHIEIILMTAYGSVEIAVESIKEGAYDFVTKPVKRAQLLKTIEKALEKQLLVIENIELRKKLKEKKKQLLVGHSQVFRKTMELIEQVAMSQATILIQGESGTGKELAAKTIQNLSNRKEKPFVVLNCGALPESIIESELFGYVKGAFTGADRNRQGRFVKAHKGTLFLDEIGELSPGIQVKLLRVLQEGEFEPLGSDKTIKVDVRFLAASNKNLAKEVEAGNFRKDLYYRLNVISVTLPSLRERKEDLPLLSTHFLNISNDKNNKSIKGVSQKVQDVFDSYSWPGNVRELENIIERAVVLSKSDFIELEDLPFEISSIPSIKSFIRVKIGTSLEEIEKTIIKETLNFTNGNKTDAAKLLGIAKRTIYRRLADENE